jgi:hypothetical protein
MASNIPTTHTSSPAGHTKEYCPGFNFDACGKMMLEMGCDDVTKQKVTNWPA